MATNQMPKVCHTDLFLDVSSTHKITSNTKSKSTSTSNTNHREAISISVLSKVEVFVYADW